MKSETAILKRIVSLGAESGFMLPVFVRFAGANVELVQLVNNDQDLVSSFVPIQVNSDDALKIEESIQVEVGAPAFWAFRDGLGQLHWGTSAKMKALAPTLLSSRALRQCPMAAAELVAFCGQQAEYPKVVTTAFDAYRRVSKVGAEIWRDTVVLLPLVKQDLDSKERRQAIDSAVSAVSHAQTTHVYAPAHLVRGIRDFPRWRAVAKVFGIQQLRIHEIASRSTVEDTELRSWCLFAIGGIPEFIMSRPPFDKFRQMSGAINTVFGPGFDDVTADKASAAQQPRHPLAIGVVRSRPDEVDLLNAYQLPRSVSGAKKHAVNIRPLGFGTPSKARIPVRLLRAALNKFDCVWVVAGHRNRQTGRYPNSLSAQNEASRQAHAAATGLIACLDSDRGRIFLDRAASTKHLGVVGTTRYLTSQYSSEVLTRMLYGMLSYDVYLHSATAIIALAPASLAHEGEEYHIDFGPHAYKVQIIHRHDGRGDVTGFAVGVRPSRGTQADFEDFCFSLLSGYKWDEITSHPGYVNAAYGGFRVRIVMAHRRITPEDLVASAAMTETDILEVIATSQSIPKAFKLKKSPLERLPLHYSEFDRWTREIGVPSRF